MQQASIEGIYPIGNTNEALYEIAVEPNRISIVQLSGLNPIAVAHEARAEVESIAKSGLVDFRKLRSFKEICFE